MQLSVSIDLREDLWAHTRFVTAEIKSVGVLKEILTKRFWSPIIFKEGLRRGVNFERSDFLALDFDDGQWGVKQAEAFCNGNGYKFMIGTTRNHMRFKGKDPPQPRFRLIIPWANPIHCRKTYEQNLKRISELLPCDKQAKDSARVFRPCKEIVSFNADHNRRGALHFAYEPPRVVSLAAYREARIIPQWVQSMLETVPAEGGRNHHAFRLAAKLAELGFSEAEVIDKVLNAPIEIPTEDKIRTAKSGFKNGSAKIGLMR